MGAIVLNKDLHPDFLAKRRTPIGQVQIDWANPLTKKLGFCLVANQAQPFDLVSRRVLTKGSGVSFSRGSYYFDGTANGIITIPDSDTNFDKRGDSTVFSVVLVANLSSAHTVASPAFLGRGDTSANEWMFRENGGALTFFGNAGDYNANKTSTVPTDVFNTYGFTVGPYGAVGNDAFVYQQGVQAIVDNTGSIDVSAITKPITIGGADGSATRYFLGRMRLVLGFHLPLTQAEHAQLHRDPYQVLKPTVPLFMPAAAAGGGPSVNVNGSTVNWNGLTSYNWNGIA